MGWFWGGNDKKEDPTKSLSPDLKDFLKDQQPRPYVPTGVPPTAKPEQKEQKPPPPLPDVNRTFEDRPLPRESLFQDGRYKHLWKTYQPHDEIVAATTTPLERIITARKDRQQLVARAALENCAFEEEIRSNCLTRGSAAERARARMTLCQEESRAFTRCRHLQAKFLIALGYLTSSTSTDEEEERIQMHADKLYHRMMDYEAAVAEAKLNDDPIPPLSSVFSPGRPAPSLEQLDLPRTMQRALKKPLQELAPHERELAVRAALQEAKIVHLYTKEFETFAVGMNEKRKQRQSWLSKHFGEPIGKFLVPDPPKEVEVEPYKMEDLERDIWKDSTQMTPEETSPEFGDKKDSER